MCLLECYYENVATTISVILKLTNTIHKEKQKKTGRSINSKKSSKMPKGMKQTTTSKESLLDINDAECSSLVEHKYLKTILTTQNSKQLNVGPQRYVHMCICI